MYYRRKKISFDRFDTDDSDEPEVISDYDLNEILEQAEIKKIIENELSFMIFVRYSYRSASEVKAILYIAFDLNYIDENNFNILFKKIVRIQQTLGGLLNYLKNRK